MIWTFRLVLVALFFATSAAAHHSAAAMYNLDQKVTLKGKVTKVEWKNPHIYCYVDVTDPNGTVRNWEVEIQANPNAMFRRGWTKDSLKVGDEVTIQGSHARRPDLDRVLSNSLILPDGRELSGDRN
jgi:hypothetical protein